MVFASTLENEIDEVVAHLLPKIAASSTPVPCVSANPTLQNLTCVYNKATIYPTACSGSQLATCILVSLSNVFQPMYLLAPCPTQTTCAMKGTTAYCGICSVPPPLGRCGNFSVMGGTAVSFSGGRTTIMTGSVGISPGTSITGAYILNSGTTETTTPLANGCAADFLVAWTAGTAAVVPTQNVLPIPDLSGLTLVPGVYSSASGTLSISAGKLTLDANGDPNAVWVFHVTTTLITASGTFIYLANGARANNVYWVLRHT